jgi:hypothetical protein
MSNIPFESRFSPEMKLLLLAARPFMTKAEGQELRASCAPAIDWQEFADIVKRHQVSDLVFKNLNRYIKNEIPAGACQLIQQSAERNQRRELTLATEMVLLNRLFTSHGFEALFFKGPALSHQFYGSFSLRHSQDLDILIGEENFSASIQLLDSNGYKLSEKKIALTPKQKRINNDLERHFTYVNPTNGLMFDLHWKLVSNPYYLLPDFEQRAFAHVARLDFAGQMIQTLSVSDHFLYLCAHGAEHGWGRLKWLCDIAAAFRNPQPFDWESIAAEVARIGLERPVAQAAELSHRLLGAPLPDSFQPLCQRASLLLLELVKTAGQFILKSEAEYRDKGKIIKKMPLASYRLKLRKELKYKAHILMHIWLEPADWVDFPLPDSLFFLYYVLRPFLWLRRYYRSKKKRQISDGRAK